MLFCTRVFDIIPVSPHHWYWVRSPMFIASLLFLQKVYICETVSEMSGNNTFGTLDFADLYFSFWSSKGEPFSPSVLMENW